MKPESDEAVAKNGRRVEDEPPFVADSEDVGEVVRGVDAVPHEPEPEEEGASYRAQYLGPEPVTVEDGVDLLVVDP